MELVHVVAAVIRRESQVLLALRPTHKRHGGLWEYPGGKVGDGESQEEALARELLEELGVGVRRTGPWEGSFSDPGSPFVIHFLSVELSGDPSPLEHAELRWVTREEALQLPLAPTDLRFTLEILRTEPNGRPAPPESSPPR
jgi:mutator protein MutT